MSALLSGWLLLILIAGPQSANGWEVVYNYGPHKLVAVAETTQVRESSGVIASRASRDIYWTHNDSGLYPPRVWAFRLSKADKARKLAKHMGYVELAGAKNVDWEDIAAGPNKTIYILDGGDNPPCRRKRKIIYRFREPKVDRNGPPIGLKVKCDTIRFEYPNSSNPSLPADDKRDRYDAESILVHPTTSDIYLITKRDSKNVAAARVFKLPAASIKWNGKTIHVLKFVADLGPKVPNTPVAADIHPTGKRLVIRNYTTAFEFILPVGKPFDDIFKQPPKTISLTFELQGEGICYGPDGDLITTTEGVADPRFKIYITPKQVDKKGLRTSTASTP
ncbi:MAG: hypothetical protein ACYTF1_03605 [Planctomycetota bacterium]|jgi:hypothetical protein